MMEQNGRKILIIEDEVLVAMHLEDLLLAMGHCVVGPATRLPDAIALARDEEIDFAVLDMNLAGTPSFPVADILRDRGIPFVFATGYGSGGIVNAYYDVPTLRKPYARRDLEQAVAKGLGLQGDPCQPGNLRR